MFTHRLAFPLHVNSGCLDPCINAKWIALPISKKVLGLWSSAERGKAKPPIELEGHESEITALSFYERNNELAIPH